MGNGLLGEIDPGEYERWRKQKELERLRWRLMVDLKRMELKRKRFLAEGPTNPFTQVLYSVGKQGEVAAREARLDERILDYLEKHELPFGDVDWRLPALLHAAESHAEIKPPKKRGRPIAAESRGLLSRSPTEKANDILDEFEKWQEYFRASGKEHSQNAILRALVEHEIGEQWDESSEDHQRAHRRKKDLLLGYRELTGRKLKPGRRAKPK